MGPGTNIIKRIKDNDEPLSEVDKTSEAHDIRYWLSNTATAVREADNIMINKIDEIEKLGTDSQFNIAQAKLMKAKRKLEDMGVMKMGSFANWRVRYDTDPIQTQMMRKKLNELKQLGYGKNNRKWHIGEAL
jgi:hypothetical protein